VKEATAQRPAVIILDMAVGYGWEPGSEGYDLVANIRRLKDAAYAAGAQVVHVTSMRRPTDGLGGEQRMLPGSDALDVIPELQPVDRDIQVYKRYLSGFSHNDLDYTLRNMGCDCVIIAGASTDNTVLWTAADAHQYRYKVVVVVEDCTIVHHAQGRPEGKEDALRIIRGVLHAEVLSLADVVARFLKPR
jgi:nicotinamidase-related amidase